MNKSLISKRASLVLALFMSLGAWSSTNAQSFPETIPLPTGFWPEGITMGLGHTAYVGSLANGSIYEVDLRTGAGTELVPGSFGLIAVGLDFDERSGYLFVAGGLTGDARVYDTRTGGLVTVIPLGGGFTNDVFVTREAAYFTDSFIPMIYKVPLTPKGELSGFVQSLPLTGDWVNIPTTDPLFPVVNGNGIVAAANGTPLVVVNYILGTIYRVDPETGFATEIDLGGESVPFGDGLILRGKTLYVVQNFTNEIAVFTLSRDFLTATLEQRLTDPDLDIPATADLFGPWLYAVNARFDVCQPGFCDPTGLEFGVVRVDQ